MELLLELKVQCCLACLFMNAGLVVSVVIERAMARNAPVAGIAAAAAAVDGLCWLCVRHSVCLIPCTGALLSLCLLAQVYDHCCDIIQNLSMLPLGAEVLVQIDRLVQLLETPAFAFLRLQLLQPSKHPDLLRALYGLLMLLPQSSAFKTLAARLQAVPAVTLMQLEALQQQGSSSSRGNKQQQQQQQQWADFDSLLKAFVVRQQAHAADEDRRRLLIEGLRIEEDIQKEQQHQAAMAALEGTAATISSSSSNSGQAAAPGSGNRESSSPTIAGSDKPSS
jgi:hypothetical protein